jgi:hypothetical protein
MKNYIILLLTLIISANTQAKKGMWLPFLLETLNEKDMQSMGMKITAKDIYDENKSSLKDAVCLFGGGCTAEVISKQGLILTNHHCGYGNAQRLSSLQNDYLKNGFWAMNTQKELPCPGLSVTFIVKIIDVTASLTNGLSDNLKDTTRVKTIASRTNALIKENTKDGYDAMVKSIFHENKFYMFITEKFTDVRMVGFPPNSIGKFGGDTDNWAWPRHTGDFSIFRIYVNKDNKPATYNINNVPYTPKRSLKINIAGTKPNDFTMVYGFPGRTMQYLTSGGVNEVMNILDPARIELRSKRLEIMDADMAKDRSIFLQYAGKQAGIANYYKKWQGELLGLKKNNGVAYKLKQEKEFNDWASADASRTQKYGQIITDINNVYDKQKQGILLNEYFNEAFAASELFSQLSVLDEIKSSLNKTKSIDSIQKYKSQFEAFYKNTNIATDKKITLVLMEAFKNKFPEMNQAAIVNTENVYTKTIIANKEKMMALFNLKNIDELKNIIEGDEGYKAYLEMSDLQSNNFNTFRKYQQDLIAKYHIYVQGIMEQKEGQAIMPDANSTLRLSYGLIEGITPKDGLQYSHYTTLDGVMEKENNSVEEFEVPSLLKELYNKKDFGNYALPNGKMPLAFLASNHTTGGNSGSPVLNAKGELIGTNFDRIWEGTMSDIMYDIDLCRNITLDVRYTLFIVEKFGKAKWLIDEMDITNVPVSNAKRGFFARLFG